MTLIFGLLKIFPKIRNELLGRFLYIVLRVHDFICMGAFFVLPFIKYPPTIRLIFLIVWVYTILIIWGGYLFFAYRAKDKLEDRREEYTRDKVVYWISEIGMCLCLPLTFLLVFIKRNYTSQFSLLETIAFFLLFVFLVSSISKLIASYKSNYMQLAKDTIISIVALLCMLSVAIGVISYNVEQPLIYNILIALGAFPLTIGALYMVCKAFLSTNMTNEKADTLTVAILLFVGIGLVTGIVLEYLVTNEDLRGILTTIFSAILGGTITLTGVAWTIKAGNDKQQKEIARIENDRKEEERKRYVPFVNLYTDKCNKPDHTITIPRVNLPCSCKKNYYIIESCFLKNTDFSAFCVSEIIINNYLIHVQPHSYIDRKWIVKIKFKHCFILDERIEYFGIQVKDMLGNVYNIAIDFEPIYYSNGFIKIKSKGCYPAELVKPNSNEKGDKQ